MGLKKWLKRIFGTTFIFAGLFVSFTDRLITGYAISSEIQNYFSYLNFLGIIIFIIGVFILLSSKQETLEKKVDVFSKVHGKTNLPPKSNYHITDPELYIGEKGFVSLGDFENGINKIRDDKELMQMVRDTYSPELKRILRDVSNPEKQRIAREFWKVLYGNEISVAEPGEILDEDEKNKIMNAFKGGWKNAPNSHQKEILSHYNLGYQIRKGSTHGEIYSFHNPHYNIITSISPSDVNAGRAIARDLMHLIERIKENN